MPTKPAINVAIIGLGQVGEKLAKALIRNRRDDANYPLRLVSICDRKKPQDITLQDVQFTTEWEQVAQAENVDVVVEAVGGGSAAYDIASECLRLGKNLVTCNRTLLAGHGEILFKIASGAGVGIGMEGAVLGGVPIIRQLINNTGAYTLTAMNGILNSTSNYILMRMREVGCTVEEATQAAVELGFAHPLVDLDTSGKDALFRMTLLRAMAFGVWTDVRRIKPVGLEGITPADMRLCLQLGYRIKQIATATEHHISVAPKLVEETTLMGRTHGSMTAVTLHTDEVGPLFMAGDSADADAVVTGMMHDLLVLARGGKLCLPQVNSSDNKPPVTGVGAFYIRTTPQHKHTLLGTGKLHLVDEAFDRQSGQVGLLVTGYIGLSSVQNLVGEDIMVMECMTPALHQQQLEAA